jgi:hypothetical protein
MTGNELRDTLVDSEELLRLNKQVVNKDMLDLAKSLLDEFRNNPLLRTASVSNMKISGDIDIDRILNVIEAAIKAEYKLVGETGDRLTEVCGRLKNRPILLGMIARIL